MHSAMAGCYTVLRASWPATGLRWACRLAGVTWSPAKSYSALHHTETSEPASVLTNIKSLQNSRLCLQLQPSPLPRNWKPFNQLDLTVGEMGQGTLQLTIYRIKRG